MKLIKQPRIELSDDEKHMITTLITCQDDPVASVLPYIESLCVKAYNLGSNSFLTEIGPLEVSC